MPPASVLAIFLVYFYIIVLWDGPRELGGTSGSNVSAMPGLPVTQAIVDGIWGALESAGAEEGGAALAKHYVLNFTYFFFSRRRTVSRTSSLATSRHPPEC